MCVCIFFFFFFLREKMLNIIPARSCWMHTGAWRIWSNHLLWPVHMDDEWYRKLGGKKIVERKKLSLNWCILTHFPPLCFKVSHCWLLSMRADLSWCCWFCWPLGLWVVGANVQHILCVPRSALLALPHHNAELLIGLWRRLASPVSAAAGGQDWALCFSSA